MGAFHEDAAEEATALAGFGWLGDAPRLIVAGACACPYREMIPVRELGQVRTQFRQDETGGIPADAWRRHQAHPDLLMGLQSEVHLPFNPRQVFLDSRQS